MRVPFTLIDNNGEPMIGKAAEASVQLSKDGAPFVDASGEIVETGSGCYYIDLTSCECKCTYYVNIKVTIDGGQMTIIQYTPDTQADDVAKAVWDADRRTLTSLSTGSTKASVFTATTKPSTPKSSSFGGLHVSQIIGGR